MNSEILDMFLIHSIINLKQLLMVLLLFFIEAKCDYSYFFGLLNVDGNVFYTWNNFNEIYDNYSYNRFIFYPFLFWLLNRFFFFLNLTFSQTIWFAY